MKHLCSLAVLLLTPVCAVSGSSTRSGSWHHNLHEVGESYPDKTAAASLLGRPDKIESVVVVRPARYAPYQPLACANPVAGTVLESWHYRSEEAKLTYLLYFQGDAMVCFATAIDAAPPEPPQRPMP